MTQPFDNRDWDLRKLAEKDAEIERWKVQHEEMLLKHAREQHTALSTLDEAMKEIERLKDKIRGLEKLNQMTDEEVVMELKAEIERLKALLARAADALDNPRAGSEAMDDDFDLIIELRKAAG
jgi:protein subunit release factor A